MTEARVHQRRAQNAAPHHHRGIEKIDLLLAVLLVKARSTTGDLYSSCQTATRQFQDSILITRRYLLPLLMVPDMGRWAHRSRLRAYLAVQRAMRLVEPLLLRYRLLQTLSS